MSIKKMEKLKKKKRYKHQILLKNNNCNQSYKVIQPPTKVNKLNLIKLNHYFINK